MAVYLTRDDRPVDEIPGMGGMLKFGRPDYQTEAAAEYTILDITAWRVRHTLKLVDVTHSGSYGAQKMAMVGRHWEASLMLAWNSRVRSLTGNPPWSGFLEKPMIGEQSAAYNVAVIFYLGDPQSYVDSNHIQRPSFKLFAPLALCGDIVVINDATGKDVVRGTASLQGNSKLQGWTGLGDVLTTKVF